MSEFWPVLGLENNLIELKMLNLNYFSFCCIVSFHSINMNRARLLIKSIKFHDCLNILHNVDFKCRRNIPAFSPFPSTFFLKKTLLHKIPYYEKITISKLGSIKYVIFLIIKIIIIIIIIIIVECK